MDSNTTPHLTDEGRRQLLGRRIVELEAEQFNYRMSIVEMEAVDAGMGKKTDADDALKQARIGLEATTLRLDALRSEYTRLFPAEESPASDQSA